MNASNQRVVLITGASSGIGRACAAHLGRKGYRVYGTSRRAPPEGEPPTDDRPFTLIPMDVTDDASVEWGVRLILEREGRLDVVVNNAGMGYAGSVEDTSIEEAREQLETNFFGALRVCRAALPHMRERGGGYIVNISSIGGLVGIPFQALYSASKFAIEGLTEALRLEVKPYNIRVSLIEPGDCCTGFTANRRKTRACQRGSVYDERSAAALAVMEKDEQCGEPLDHVAHLLERIITHPAPRLRYQVGPLPERVAIWLKRFVPSAMFEWGLSKYYKLS